jgi:aldehyde dehydrogenase (NAD+)
LLNHIISGIFAGNAVVGKVSEYTCWSSLYYSRIVRQALQVHGHDPDLVQTVTGFGDAGSALVADPLVDKIIFTGSPEIGKKVMTTAAQHLKPVILELGGKDVMVICDDVKLESSVVIPHCMRGCFQNCGQNCIGVERVLVYESIYDTFLNIVVPKVDALRQGIPLATCGSTGNVDCASMVTAFQIDAVQELVDDAVFKGANLHCGGRRSDLPGQFYIPTVLSGVTPEMRIFSEEVFGPIMTVIKVPKDDDDECLRLVNGTRFGLGSSVYSANKARALRLARQFRTGMCTVNDFASNYLVQSLPFGGVKESGFGRFGGIEGLQALCLERSLLVDRIPGIQTSIPPPLDYPIDPHKGMAFGESLIQFFYNETWIGKIKGILGLIKNG